MKRFYKQVTVVEDRGGYVIALDDRPINTPAKTRLVLPSIALAEAVAREWREQGDEVKPLEMPLMRLASTAIDRIGAARSKVVDDLAGYAETDLLCYRADHPPELVARQRDAWQPLLDWAREHHGATLEVTTGVVPTRQPAGSVAALRQAVEAMDDLGLAALHAATTAAGSLVVGLALLEARLDPDAAFEVCELDESYQIERWGEDEEATVRRENVRLELRTASEFVRLAAASA